MTATSGNSKSHTNVETTPRVLHLICPTGFYGAERWILALANQMTKDNDVCHLAITSEDADRSFDIYDRYPGAAGNKYRIELKGRFDISAIKQLAKLVNDERINIIHTHGYKSDIIGYFVAKKANIFCVSTPHGFGFDIDFKLKLFIRLGGLFLRRFDRVAPLSQELVDNVIDFGVSEDRIHLINNATDLNEVTEAKLVEVEKTTHDIIRIGYVGQLIPRKRINHLIEVFAKLSKHHPNIELVLAGNGAAIDELKELSQSLNCSEKITFLGYIEERLVLMRSLDMFIMTSASEGIPRSMMEAMALGVPVAAYDISGVDAIVKHEETGLLAESGNMSELESIIARLLFDPELLKRLGTNGQKHIENNFSAERMANEYRDLYAGLLNASAS